MRGSESTLQPRSVPAAHQAHRRLELPATHVIQEENGGKEVRQRQATSALDGLHTPLWLRELAVDAMSDMLARWLIDGLRPRTAQPPATRLDVTGPSGTAARPDTPAPPEAGMRPGTTAPPDTAAPPDTGAPASVATADIAFNRPFPGAMVPSRYFCRDARVLSLMIELRRHLYMDEESGGRLAGSAGCAAAAKPRYPASAQH